MKFRRWQWVVYAALASSVAVAVLAQENKPTSEKEAFGQFQAACQPKVAPAPDATREEQIAQAKEFFGGVIKAGDSYLQTYPNGENANAVRFGQIRAIKQLLNIEDSEELSDKAQKTLNEILESKPEERVAFEAHTWLLSLTKTPENAALRVETMKREFPKSPYLPEPILYLASLYLQTGDSEKALKTAQTVIDEFPESSAVAKAMLFQADLHAQRGDSDNVKKTVQSIIGKFQESNTPEHAQVVQRAKMILKKSTIFGSPIELSFTSLDGKTVDIKNYRGKIVLVDFWATWCGPCIAELPNVLKTYTDYHDKGFEIIGISLDKNKKSLTDFVAARKMPWPQYFDGKGWENEISSKFGIQSIPATFLLNKDGKVVRTDLRGEALARAVAELLKAE